MVEMDDLPTVRGHREAYSARRGHTESRRRSLARHAHAVRGVSILLGLFVAILIPAVLGGRAIAPDHRRSRRESIESIVIVERYVSRPPFELSQSRFEFRNVGVGLLIFALKGSIDAIELARLALIAGRRLAVALGFALSARFACILGLGPGRKRRGQTHKLEDCVFASLRTV